MKLKETEKLKTWVVLLFVFIVSNAELLFAGEVMKLTESDSGKTVEIVVGDKLEITLPGNPTTGYVWEASSLNPSVLQLDSSGFVANTNAPGSDGVEVIKLQAIAEGSSEVRSVYHRTFERNVPPLKTFSLIVIIRKAWR